MAADAESVDKIAHVVLLADDLADVHRTGVAADVEFAEAAEKDLVEHLQAGVRMIRHAGGTGMTLMIVGGRQRLPLAVYDAVFTLILTALRQAKLVRGKSLAIDTSVLEANASLRSLHHRLTGEQYRQYVRRLATAAGVDPTEPRAVSAFDRKRPGRKTSNREWQNPHDPDAKIGPDKKGVTRMLYKPEHVVDLETGAIVDVELKPGDEPDAAELPTRVRKAEERVNAAAGEPPGLAQVTTVVGDMAYCAVAALVELQTAGVRTAIPDPVHRRQVEKLPDDQRRALQNARRTVTSASGKHLMRQGSSASGVSGTCSTTVERGGRRSEDGRTFSSGIWYRPRVSISRSCCATPMVSGR